MEQCGKVWLAGAGPGDARLLTVKTKELLSSVDTIVYDALISTEILCQIPPEKETIYVGKRSGHHTVPQDEINQILLCEAQKGKQVLRLKGGDPFVFGRGGEELELLVEHGVPFEIVPGITSAAAVPAYAGIPVTHREYTSSFHVITGHPRKDGTSRVDYPSLVSLQGTLVFLMGVSSMEEICEGLLRAGMRPDMPAAVVEKGTMSRQRRIVSDVKHLSQKAKEEQVETPAIILVGEVCGLSDVFSWSEKRPLGNRQFLITRPRQHSAVLAGKLRELGAQVLEVPSIRTEMIHPNPKLQDALTTFAMEGEEAWLVFTSPIGVHTFFEELKEEKQDMRKILRRKAEVKIAVIGSATKAALQTYGWQEDLMPSVYDAHSLGTALAKEAKEGSEILIARAQKGSMELLLPLIQAKMRIMDISLYQTVHELQEELKELLLQEMKRKAVDAVVFTSSSTVCGFAKSMGEEGMKWASKLPAVCIGQQTAAEAKKYGMTIHVAKQASIQSLVELLRSQFGDEEQEVSKESENT